MSELRKKFESLPEVIDSLSCHIRIGSDGLYYTSLVNFEKLTAWLNGAWYAFQEQQAKIDELQNIIDELKNHIEINFDEDREDDQHSYWSGYNQALREIKDIG